MSSARISRVESDGDETRIWYSVVSGGVSGELRIRSVQNTVYGHKVEVRGEIGDERVRLDYLGPGIQESKIMSMLGFAE